MYSCRDWQNFSIIRLSWLRREYPDRGVLFGTFPAPLLLFIIKVLSKEQGRNMSPGFSEGNFIFTNRRKKFRKRMARGRRGQEWRRSRGGEESVCLLHNTLEVRETLPQLPVHYQTKIHLLILSNLLPLLGTVVLHLHFKS